MYLTKSQLTKDEQVMRVKATNWAMLNLEGTLYWLHTEDMTNPYKEGYVGITQKTAEERFKGHAKAEFDALGIDRKDVRITVLQRGKLHNLNNLERDYRPAMGMGWNYSQGGNLWSGMGTVAKDDWMEWYQMMEDNNNE